jgi:hypothetical protein
MSLSPNSATAQKAGYILLTSAMFHANNQSATTILLMVRSSIADDMTLPVLQESIELITALVYPRFSYLN